MWEKNKKNEDRSRIRKQKIGQQKSMCLVCDSKKSTFLKPIKPITNKKQKHANLLFRV